MGAHLFAHIIIIVISENFHKFHCCYIHLVEDYHRGQFERGFRDRVSFLTGVLSLGGWSDSTRESDIH